MAKTRHPHGHALRQARWVAIAELTELLDTYRRLYPRAYAPSATQVALAALVSELVTRHGGQTTPPRQAIGRARRTPRASPSCSPPAGPRGVAL